MITQRQLFLRHVAQTSPSPLSLEIESARGIYLYDTSGKSYMDLISGIAVSNLGHSHPRVVSAIREQLDRYMHLMVYGEYIQSPQVRLAQKLCGQLPLPLDSVYFTNSGSEAIEGAMKLSKRYTGRTEIISFRNAYHGSTQGALSIMGDEFFKTAFRPLLPDVKILNFNSPGDLHHISRRTACVIVEPVQGEAGAIPADAEFMTMLAETCRRQGAMLVLDEIQSGFGRTGRLFAFSEYGIVPDILTVAKGMGGGMPLGAFIASGEIMQSLTHEPVLGHITTFGGHPVCCAAGLACLETLLDERIPEQVEAKGQLFRTLLRHPSIKSISGKGLMLALEFETGELNRAVISRCIEKGVIIDWFLFADNRMRIAPPLIITEEEISAACRVILQSITEATA
jgi:acetylornithine/N-succinyldiaminopimelate aminotransferase